MLNNDINRVTKEELLGVFENYNYLHKTIPYSTIDFENDKYFPSQKAKNIYELLTDSITMIFVYHNITNKEFSLLDIQIYYNTVNDNKRTGQVIAFMIGKAFK